MRQTGENVLVGRLETRIGTGGLRHYLDGGAVHAGDVLELQMPDGSWCPARYEGKFWGDGIRAGLWAMLPGKDGTRRELHEEDVLR